MVVGTEIAYSRPLLDHLWFIPHVHSSSHNLESELLELRELTSPMSAEVKTSRSFDIPYLTPRP